MPPEVIIPEGLTAEETTFHYKVDAGSFAQVAGLLEVPELGGAPEKVDATTLEHKTKRFIPGIIDAGDMAMKFQYDNSSTGANYRVLKGLQTLRKKATFKVQYPDGSAHQFDAYIAVKMDSVGVAGKLTFTVTFMLQSDITETDPV